MRQLRAMKSWRLSSYTANSVIRHTLSAYSKASATEQSHSDSDDDIPANMSDGSSDSLDEDDEKELSSMEFRAIHDFLFNSEAYGVFKADLLSFVHKSYEKRVSMAIGEDLIGHSGEHLDKSALHCLARELSWIPTRLFTFSIVVDSSYGKDAKAFVEDGMGETWIWWPLGPRLPQLRPGYGRLQWKSVCVSSVLPAPGKAMLTAYRSHVVYSATLTFQSVSRRLYAIRSTLRQLSST